MSDAYTQRALRILLAGPQLTKEFVGLVAGPDRTNFNKSEYTALISRLKRNNLIRVHDAKYYITDAGRVMADPESDMHVRSGVVSKMSGVYTCPELGRTCFRPGAYDFLDIPSVFGSERRPYSFKSGIN